jgi:ubiquinone/menaquinone biosynthesis C-methylase UbiE
MVNRPGGFIITDKALSFCSFPKDAKILDLGCGSGCTVNHIIENYGLIAYGLDKNIVPEDTQQKLIKATAEDIPCSAKSFDAVLMECSFSVMDEPEKVLSECFRVLKSQGHIIISDMYARGESAHLKGCLGRLEKKQEIIARIENAGFAVELFEDHTQHLLHLWGQIIFDKGAETFYSDLGVCTETMKKIKCGYCLIIAKKKEQNT